MEVHEKYCARCGDGFRGTADVCYACPEGDYCLHCGDELSADKYGEMYCDRCDDEVEHCKGCETDCDVNDDKRHCTHATGITLFDGIGRTGQVLQIALCTWGCNQMLIMRDNKVFTSLCDAFKSDIS